MKPLFLLSNKLGTAIQRFSCILPDQARISENQLINALQRLMKDDQGLSSFTVAYQDSETDVWYEIDATTKRTLTEEEKVDKILNFVNSMVQLNQSILGDNGEFNLETAAEITFFREYGFANIHSAFLLGQLGFVDTTLLIK